MTPQPQQHQLPAVAAAVVYPHQGRRVTGDVGRKPPPPPPAPAMGDKSKKQWEHVPAVLTDRGKTYIIRDILGEGGFARCYRAIPEDGSKPDFAVKVVPKTSLKNLKTRNKVYSPSLSLNYLRIVAERDQDSSSYETSLHCKLYQLFRG